MALTNNEKQIRYKKMEKLKDYAKDVMIQMIMQQGMSFDLYNRKSDNEIRDEINSIVNLPSGWTNEDYNFAFKKLQFLQNAFYDNPNLLKTDISEGHPINKVSSENEYRRAVSKAPEVIQNIKSILKLAELNKSDQIAVVAEVMRRLAKELLNEREIPVTYANAVALSLIGHQYDKPEWTWQKLAENLAIQNGKDKAKRIVKELKNPNVDKDGGLL